MHALNGISNKDADPLAMQIQVFSLALIPFATLSLRCCISNNRLSIGF